MRRHILISREEHWHDDVHDDEVPHHHDDEDIGPGGTVREVRASCASMPENEAKFDAAHQGAHHGEPGILEERQQRGEGRQHLVIGDEGIVQTEADVQCGRERAVDEDVEDDEHDHHLVDERLHDRLQRGSDVRQPDEVLEELAPNEECVERKHISFDIPELSGPLFAAS